MPKIPITPVRRDTDDAARANGLVELVDGYLDGLDDGGFSINRRGGLWTFWNGSQGDVGIDGLYYWSEKNKLIVVTGGRVFAFSDTVHVPVEISSDTIRMNIGVNVSFATNGAWLWMCNDSKMVAWNGTEARILANDPNFATVAFLAGSFIANLSDSSLAWATDTNFINSPDFPLWKNNTFFDATDSPDALTAVGVGWSELLMFGPRSVEVWAPSGDADLFVKLQGAPIERGILSKATILKFQNSWWWLDPERKLIRLNGRNPEPISLAFDRPFRSMTTADDCRAFIIDNRFLCFTFPSADYTFVYDTYNQGWAKWSFFNTETGLHERFLGQCAAFVPEWNLQFVGSRKNSQVLIYHQNLVTDQYNPIRCVARTAHLDFGTMKLKQSKKLMLRLKRGA